VEEAFTDFAVFQPWRFEPLAWTETQRGILHPQIPERYPCVARLVNTETGGEILLIGHSVATRLKASEVLAGCGMELA
jgi:hypothetical protein